MGSSKHHLEWGEIMGYLNSKIIAEAADSQLLSHIAVLETRWTNALGRHRELYLDSVSECDGFETFRYILVHDRTVSVSLDVCAEPLQGLAPRDLAAARGNLRRFENDVTRPCIETIEVLPDAKRLLVGDHVHERISKANPLYKVYWQVDKIIATLEALGIQ